MGFIERLPDLQRLGAKNVPAQVLIRIFVKAFVKAWTWNYQTAQT
jgi:hypothetical protein